MRACSRRPPSPCVRTRQHRPYACVPATIAQPPNPGKMARRRPDLAHAKATRSSSPSPSTNFSISLTKYRGEKWYLKLARVAPPVLVPNSSDPARERARGRAVALHGRGSVVQMWTMGSSLRGCLNFRRPYRRAAGSLFSPHDRVYGFARPFPRATRDALTVAKIVGCS
jgi:hypothetical protein